MKVGDKVKIKINDELKEATIVCVYAVPKDWDLVDLQFDNGDMMRGVSTELLTLSQNEATNI